MGVIWVEFDFRICIYGYGGVATFSPSKIHSFDDDGFLNCTNNVNSYGSAKKEDNLFTLSNEITPIKVLAKGACRPNLQAELK